MALNIAEWDVKMPVALSAHTSGRLFGSGLEDRIPLTQLAGGNETGVSITKMGLTGSDFDDVNAVVREHKPAITAFGALYTALSVELHETLQGMSSGLDDTLPEGTLRVIVAPR